ncbi:MAG: hypothetical protein R3F60_28625 [bacterium]
MQQGIPGKHRQIGRRCHDERLFQGVCRALPLYRDALCDACCGRLPQPPGVIARHRHHRDRIIVPSTATLADLMDCGEIDPTQIEAALQTAIPTLRRTSPR